MPRKCVRFKKVRGVRRCAKFTKGRARSRARVNRSQNARSRAADRSIQRADRSLRGTIAVCFPHKPHAPCKTFPARRWRGALDYARIGSQYAGPRNVYFTYLGRRALLRRYVDGRTTVRG